MRSQALSAIRAGMTRLLTKGGAAADSLYELTNGYVNNARRPTQRPGTEVDTTLPAGTKGLFQHLGKLNVVASSAVTITDPDYAVHVIKHPTLPAATLVEIHFAEPFLRYPYIVAEWSDGSTVHYWLQARDAWSADAVYADGDLVFPTVPNGYAYRAKRLAPPAQPWAANVARAIGDRVAPTDGGNYEHVVTAVLGSSPRSGATEPDWAESDGGITYEDTDLVVPPVTPPSDDGGTTLPDDVLERYRENGFFRVAERIVGEQY